MTEIRLKHYDEITELLSETKENVDAEVTSRNFSLEAFGVDIPYHPARVVWPDTSKLHSMSTGINSTTDKFTMKLDEVNSYVQKKSVVGIR